MTEKKKMYSYDDYKSNLTWLIVWSAVFVLAIILSKVSGWFIVLLLISIAGIVVQAIRTITGNTKVNQEMKRAAEGEAKFEERNARGIEFAKTVNAWVEKAARYKSSLSEEELSNLALNQNDSAAAYVLGEIRYEEANADDRDDEAGFDYYALASFDTAAVPAQGRYAYQLRRKVNLAITFDRFDDDTKKLVEQLKTINTFVFGDQGNYPSDDPYTKYIEAFYRYYSMIMTQCAVFCILNNQEKIAEYYCNEAEDTWDRNDLFEDMRDSNDTEALCAYMYISSLVDLKLSRSVGDDSDAKYIMEYTVEYTDKAMEALKEAGGGLGFKELLYLCMNLGMCDGYIRQQSSFIRQGIYVSFSMTLSQVKDNLIWIYDKYKDSVFTGVKDMAYEILSNNYTLLPNGMWISN